MSVMIAVLGISHKSAPVNIREIFAFDEQEKVVFADLVRADLKMEGMVILSTCNRMEIYFNTPLQDDSEVFSLVSGALMRYKKIGSNHFPYFYFYTRQAAVEQLFKVASGLDSLVLGEEQILVQVKDAFRNAQSYQLTDSIMSRLFIKAIEAGKRVRTETHLNKGAASVSYAAVELSRELLPIPEEQSVLVVGAGQTADLILQSLLKKCNPAIYIANRTYQRGFDLALKYTATAFALTDLEEILPKCDLVFTATSSKEHLISRNMVENAMEHRNNKTQIYIDLSVPTNVDEQVRELDHVQYYAVDDLKEVVYRNVERRKTAIDQSMEIIAEVMNEFMSWLDYQNLTPTIINIKESLKSVHQAEVEGFKKMRKIKENELIEQYSEHISEKYAQQFIKKLKQVTDNGKKTEYIKVINDLFEVTGHD